MAGHGAVWKYQMSSGPASEQNCRPMDAMIALVEVRECVRVLGYGPQKAYAGFVANSNHTAKFYMNKHTSRVKFQNAPTQCIHYI